MSQSDPFRAHRAIAAAIGALLSLALSTSLGCTPEPAAPAAAPPGLGESVQSVEGTWQVTEQLNGLECSQRSGLIQSYVWITRSDGAWAITARTADGELHGTFRGGYASWTGEVPLQQDGVFLTITALDVKLDGDTFAGTASWILRRGSGGPELCSGESTLSGERIAPLRPEAPSHLEVTLEGTTAHLTWQDESDDETGFVMYYQEGATVYDFEQSNDLPVGPNRESGSIEGLVEGRLYGVSVRAENEGGASSAPMEWVVVGDVVQVPAAPTRLQVDAALMGAVRLSWVDEASDEASYRVYRSTSPSSPGEVIFSLPANTTQTIDGPPAPDTTYYYFVSAVNAAGESALVGPGEATTAPDIIGPWTIGARIWTSDGDCPPDEIDFEEPAIISRPNATTLSILSPSFEVWAALDGRSTMRIFGLALLGETDLLVFPNSIAKIAPDVRAIVASLQMIGECEWGGYLDFQRGGPPAVPARFLVKSMGPESVTLEWEDVSDNEEGFEIRRSDGVNVKVRLTPPSHVIARLGAGTTSWTDHEVDPDTQYLYYVTAVNQAGASSSPGLSVTTPTKAVTPPGSAPFSVGARALSSSTVEVTWSASSGEEDGFWIMRGTDEIYLRPIDSVDRNVRSYLDTSARPDTVYYYTVMAFNAGGLSDEGNLALAVTPPEVRLDPPTNLSATATGPNSVLLEWTDNAAYEDGHQIFVGVGDCSSLSWLRSVPRDRDSELITGITSDTYCFAVAAYGGGDVSAMSNQVLVTLSPGAASGL